MSSLRLATLIACTCFGALLLWTIYRGLDTHQPTRHLDGEVMFIAGQCLAKDMSPYDDACFSNEWQKHFGREKWDSMLFPYPVTMFGLVYPLGLLEWNQASRVIDSANLIALAGILLVLALWIRDSSAKPKRSLRIAIGCATAISCGAVTAVLTIGQTSLIAVAGLVWAAFLAAHKHRNAFWFGMAILVASIKPQITFVPAIAILLFASRRQVLAAVLILAIAIGATLAVTGWQVISEFFGMLRSYREIGSNQGPNIVGLAFLVDKLGGSLPLVPAIGLAAVAVAAFMAFVWRKLPISDSSVLGRALDTRIASGIIVAASFWLPLHSYDLVVYMMPLAFLALLNLRSAIILLPGFLALARPNIAAALTGGIVEAPLVQSLAMLYVMIVACLQIAIAAPHKGWAAASSHSS